MLAMLLLGLWEVLIIIGLLVCGLLTSLAILVVFVILRARNKRASASGPPHDGTTGEQRES